MANENIFEKSNIPYTLGRGKLLIADFFGGPWTDLGNIVSFNQTVASEKLDHRSSRGGVKTIDKSTITQRDFTGQMVIDTPLNSNMRLFLMAAAETAVNQSSGTLSAVNATLNFNKYTDLGKKNLTGTPVVTHSSGSPTYVANTDYVIDMVNGLIAPVEGGAITDGQVVKVTATYPAATISRIDAATVKNQKKHIWFVGNAPEGIRQDIKGFANLLPSGDLGMIGDEWQQFTLDLTFERDTNYNAIVEYYNLGLVSS